MVRNGSLVLSVWSVEAERGERHSLRIGEKAVDIVKGIDHEDFFVNRRVKNFDKVVAGVVEVNLAVTQGARHYVIRLCGNNIALLFKRRTSEFVNVEDTFRFHNGYHNSKRLPCQKTRFLI
jgi:hypothetical protein